jgi:hypothetical protein
MNTQLKLYMHVKILACTPYIMPLQSRKRSHGSFSAFSYKVHKVVKLDLQIPKRAMDILDDRLARACADPSAASALVHL